VIRAAADANLVRAFAEITVCGECNIAMPRPRTAASAVNGKWIETFDPLGPRRQYRHATWIESSTRRMTPAVDGLPHRGDANAPQVRA
jgi:hypothetical protein